MITALSHFSVKFRVKRMILTIHYFSQRNLEGKKMANEEAHQGLHSCIYQEGNSFTIAEVMKLFIIIGVLSYLSILFKLMFV